MNRSLPLEEEIKMCDQQVKNKASEKPEVVKVIVRWKQKKV